MKKIILSIVLCVGIYCGGNAQQIINEDLSVNGKLHVSTTTLNFIDRYIGNNPFIGAAFRFRTARGSISSPLANLEGDWLGSLNFTGHDGTNFSNYTAAAITCYAAENFSTNSQGTGLLFYTTPIGTKNNATVKMKISPNGDVGIGTEDTKGFKLGVNGKIATTEVKVATYNNWPDFVFKERYKLPTLKQVENYIKEKGHLKDIPSAKEVEKNGILLGEMNSKLLQKIEELTLYTIQQEKKIEEQSKEIIILKSLNEKIVELQKRLEKLERK